MRKLLISVFSLITMAMFLTACQPRHTEIFKKEKDPYVIKEYKSEELKNDVYYVKTGTTFIPVYLPETVSFSNAKVQSPASDRVVWLGKNEKMIPTMYKGDVIALKSESTNISELMMERFMDVGYSIGVHGATFQDKKIVFSYKQSAEKGSPAWQAIDGNTSDNIEILGINNEEVIETMLDHSGVITCFEKDQTYQLSYNTGTTYKTCKVNASVHMLESWEMYSLIDIEMTKKGYIQIKMPDDLKSGWYFIEGQGFFKYIAHERGGGGIPTGEDMNHEYYSSEEARRAAYSQVFSVTFDKKTLNPTLEVIYDHSTLLNGQEIEAYFVSPDGTDYLITRTEKPALDTEDSSKYNLKQTGYLTCDLKEAIAGKWNIYVAPKNLTIAKINILSNGLDEQAREDTRILSVSEDMKNVTVYIKYVVTDNDKKPYLNGLIVFPDGTSYSMLVPKNTKNDDDKELTYNISYLPAGEYTVKFYHYSNVETGECNIRDNTEIQGEEIIHITG